MRQARRLSCSATGTAAPGKDEVEADALADDDALASWVGVALEHNAALAVGHP